jgi:protein-tyrosine phosphatase
MNQLNNAEQQLWKRALLWLIFLGPFFFTTYGFATWYTAQLDTVGSYYFEWEKQIPLIPWTIIPYWTIDIFYGISLFICTTKLELDSHAKRLLTAQIIAVSCFLLFPLTFSFERPEVTGFAGTLFDTLYSFDKPFNQAPSLHIALLVILWDVYIRHLPFRFHWVCHFIALLILVSVLTTFQHHFIDIPTGFLLGLISLWLWPLNTDSPVKNIRITKDKRCIKLALYYFIGSILFGSIAFYFEGVILWLIWPAWSLFLVSIFYLLLSSNGFQKYSNGKMSLASQWMLYPYLITARINSYLWTRKSKAANLICDQVSLGRFPTKSEIEKTNYKTIIDLTAEFNAPKSKVSWISIPCLDLVSPEAYKLLQALEYIEQSLRNGSVLVCCALGYSRSTLTVLSWLVVSNRVSSIDDGIKIIKLARPKVVLKESDTILIKQVIMLAEKNKS